MTISIFGKLSDIVKEPPVMTVPLTLGEFKTTLYKQYPELQSLVITIAVDQQLSDDDGLVLTEASEIALLPPFSGG